MSKKHTSERAPEASEKTMTLAVEQGDAVMILRNLDHPTWKQRIGSTLVPRPGMTEVIGVRHVARIHRHDGGAEAFITDGFWYDLETGHQTITGATRIRKLNGKES